MKGEANGEQYFNPRFPWGKRRFQSWQVFFYYRISIHASRGGSDRLMYLIEFKTWKFQSTLPVGEATLLSPVFVPSPQEFQSTLPVGEATAGRYRLAATAKFQSTLPVGEATPRGDNAYGPLSISIHASRGGSDPGRLKAPPKI